MIWLLAIDVRSKAPSIMNATIVTRKKVMVVVGIVERHPSNTAALRIIKLAYTDLRAVLTPPDITTKLAHHNGVLRALMQLSGNLRSARRARA